MTKRTHLFAFLAAFLALFTIYSSDVAAQTYEDVPDMSAGEIQQVMT